MAVHPDALVPALPAAFLAARRVVPAVRPVPDDMADAARSEVDLPVAAHSVAGRRVVVLLVSLLPELPLPDAARSAAPVARAPRVARAVHPPVALPVQALPLPVSPPPELLASCPVPLVLLELVWKPRPVPRLSDVSPELPDVPAQRSASARSQLPDGPVPQVPFPARQALPLQARSLERPVPERRAPERQPAPPALPVPLPQGPPHPRVSQASPSPPRLSLPSPLLPLLRLPPDLENASAPARRVPHQSNSSASSSP